MDSYFIPYRNKGGTVVDWNFQSIIHCFNWSKHNMGYAGSRTLNNKYILMHRLLLKFPKEVDHINGKRNDNRYENLRSVSRLENNQNLKIHRNGRLPGTCFDKHANKWKSGACIGGKSIHIGNYDTEIEAHEAYIKYYEDIT